MCITCICLLLSAAPASVGAVTITVLVEMGELFLCLVIISYSMNESHYY